MDRKKLREEMNRVKDLYQDTRVGMEKARADVPQMQKLRNLTVDKLKSLVAEHGDALTKEKQLVKGGTALGGLSQAGLPDASKVVGQGKEGMWSALKKGKLKGKLGLALLPAAAAMMLPKDSMAGEIAQKTSDVTGAIDPLSRALEAVSVHGAGEGSDQVTPEMQKQLADEQTRHMVKQLGGPADVSPRQVPAMLGQQPERTEFKPGNAYPEETMVDKTPSQKFNNLRSIFNEPEQKEQARLEAMSRISQQPSMQKAPPEEVPHETLDEQSSKFRNLLNMISGGKR